MPNALDREELLRLVLTDAGCDKKLIDECMRCFESGTPDAMLPKLAARRK